MGTIATLAGITLRVASGLFEASLDTQTETLMRIGGGQIDEIVNAAAAPNSPQSSRLNAYRNQTAAYLDARWPVGSDPSPAAFQYVAAKMTREALLPQSFRDLCGIDGLPGRPGVDDAGSITGVDAVGAVLDISELGLGRPYSDDPPTADLFREYARELSAGGALDLSRHTIETESSELLYAMLTVDWMGADAVVGESGLPGDSVGDTDNDGLPELLDSWGNPLQFYHSNASLVRPTLGVQAFTFATPLATGDADARPDYDSSSAEVFPLLTLAPRMVRSFTRDIDMPPATISGTNTGAAINRDSDDPLSILDADRRSDGGGTPELLGSDAVDYQQYPSGVSLANAILPPVTAAGYTGPVGTAGRFMIVSAGPDGRLGMYPPTNEDGTRYAEPILGDDSWLDNVTNLQVGGL